MSTIDIGGAKDEVVLRLAGEDVVIAESYDIDCSFLTQPAAFAIHLGSDVTAREIAEAYPPRTPFEIRINGRTVQSGLVDGTEISGPPTSVTIHGRDYLQVIHDAFVRQEKTFTNATFAQLVEGALKDVGYPKATLVFTNTSNRKAITGGNVNLYSEPKFTAEDRIDSVGGGKLFRTPQSKLGEKWYDFLKRHLDRVGLFLWNSGQLDAGQPVFVISEPNPKQAPLYRILNRRGERGEVSVLKYQRGNDAKPRYSDVAVYARGGGKSFGRGKAKGLYADTEMEALGYERSLTIRDADCVNEKQAVYLARRKLAETRRAGKTVSYTVAGHTTTSLRGERVVWAVDTMVDVDDDETGIHQAMWIEGVHFSRSGSTSTTLKLMFPEDLLFGDLGAGT